MPSMLRRLPTAVLTALLPLASIVPTPADERPPVVDPSRQPQAALAADLDPLWSCLTGSRVHCAVSGTVTVTRGAAPVAVAVRFERHDAASYDLSLEHADYAVVLRRRADATALALPRHRIVHVGRGATDPVDHLDPAGLGPRLVSDATQAVVVKPLVAQSSPALLAGLAAGLLGIRHDPEDDRWERGDGWLDFDDAGRRITADAEGVAVRLAIGDPGECPGVDDFAGYEQRSVPRDELERTICRGIRRGLEILLPGPPLSSPDQESRSVEHGRLEWREGLRVVTLHGSPEEIGRAHGALLAAEARRCIDSVLHVVGLADTIRQGTWFRTRLDDAARRLLPHIPERHRRETLALADALGLDPAVVAAANVFPELFHCSGFTVSGSATTDGTLYHGRVLDYMTVIGLQDAAAAFVIAPEGAIPFVSVGYAGFTGSVSGMNLRGISLGEMGGGGEGKWDGVPMATLMRRALEECGTLDDVVDLWTRSPRTCEYYYVFADGKTRESVGVAATPDHIEFVKPGGGHERLGPGIPDCVVLSAGDRLECLRQRVRESFGGIDEAGAIRLMARPVAAASNLHNVLFVPERLLLHVAHASHTKPAADCPSVRLDLAALVQAIPSARAADTPLPGFGDAPRARAAVPGATFRAADTLAVGDEPRDDARQCLDGLRWEPRPFDVAVEAAVVGQGDLRVRFPSPCDGVECNRDVWMEWYRARDAAGDVTAGPACVVVHESGSNMVVGRLVARGLSAYGIHAFLVQLPFYGARRPPGGRPGGEVVLPAVRQAVADVRRARDAVAVLPLVDAARIGLQGTSLGGFITATVAGLDRAYDKVFIMLAGGDLAGVLENGKRDAEKVRRKLAEAGLGDAEVRASLHAIEPTRLAHRYRAERTWIYSAKHDDVVPPAHSKLLAEAAGLPADHHLEMEANHYTGIVYLPMVLARIAGEIHGTGPPARPAAKLPVEPAAEPAAPRAGPSPAGADAAATQTGAFADDAATPTAPDAAPAWKAGVARIAITPSDSLWMSGYAARDRPADGKLTDLWAKALAIEDPAGRRHVLVTLDLVGIDRVTGQGLAAAVAARFGLPREAVVFSTSHTHSGPVIRDNLRTMYALDDAAWALVRRYGEQLRESVVKVVGDALADLRPAELAWTVGRAHFAVNRRNNPEKEVPALRAADRLAGPVDHDVPVLLVREPGGSGPESVRGIAVGYACHATVLSGYQWSGDWPGYAQIELEKRFPNATALTWVGCGADQNPLPRRTVELAERYGVELAAAVSAAIDRRLVPLGGTLAAAYAEIPLEFSSLPSRADLERAATSTDRFEAARARMLLESWDRDGGLPTSYPYPVQTWRLGDGPHWVFLGGEVVVDFAVRLKSELGCGRTWVAAYSNDVMAYVASRRVLAEGGYEGGGAMVYYGLPAAWAASSEEGIVAAVRGQVAATGGVSAAAVRTIAPRSYPDHADLTVVRGDDGALEPIESEEDWSRRRRDILAGMQAVMGRLPETDELGPLAVEERGRETLEGCTRTLVTYAAGPGQRVTAHLYLPAAGSGAHLVAADGRRPAVLALHPTSRLGKLVVAGEGSKANRGYAVELARRGYVVLAPDYPSFGDLADYDFHTDAHASGTMAAIVNHRRGVDLLAARPDVDAARIGAIGHSLGGHNAIFVGVFDPRIKAVVSSCGWDPFPAYMGGRLGGWAQDRYMQRVRELSGLDPKALPFDFPEAVAALAPRGFFSASPQGDDNFSAAAVAAAEPGIRRVYTLLGAADAFIVRQPDCGHDFPPEIRAEAYAFLDRFVAERPSASP